MSSGVSACSFALAMPFAGHSELTPCPFPALLPSPASGRPGSRTGLMARPPLAAPQASLTRVTARR